MIRFLSALLFTACLFGQAQNNCQQVGSFTAGGTSVVYDNTQNGHNCNTWVLTVNTSSTSISAMSIQLEGAGPGTSSFNAVTAQTVTGASANPCTTVAGCVIYATVYFNQMRVNLTSLTGTGTVTYTLLGSSGVSAKNSLGGGGSPTGAAGGDLSGTYPNPTVAQVNGGAVPTSATVVGTNGSKQIVASTVQGNGAKVQLSTGTTTTNDCVKFDANGNTVDAGAACGGGGTTVTVAAPYVTIGGTKYVAQTMWPFTAFFSGSFLDGVTSTLTAGANGSELFSFTASGAQNSWYSVAATTSIEAEFNTRAVDSHTGAGEAETGGIWMCDTTNNRLTSLEAATQSAGNYQHVMLFVQWTLAGCAGTPSAPTNILQVPMVNIGINHFRLIKTGGNLLAQFSLDSGQTYSTINSTAVGTITKAGVDSRTNQTATVASNFLSVVVN